MLKYIAIAAAIAILAGCSSSTSGPPPGFALQITSATLDNSHSPLVEVFDLVITNNGTGVQGATLVANVYQGTKPTADTLKTKSDVNGMFKAIGVQIQPSTTGIVFQAFKDTLKSNTIPWQP